MANKYWIGGGANTNWNTSANWSLSSGGAAGGGIPTSADVANFTGVGANANGTATISATITVGGLIITSGFTGTIVHNAVLTCSATLTLGANYTISGSASMTINLATSITSNGKAWPNNVTFTGSGTTKTLVDDWTVGTFVSSSTTILNGNNLYTSGATITSPISGTTDIHFTGTGTWSGSQAISNDLFLEGDTTVSGVVAYNVGTMTYVSGTISATGSTLELTSNPTLITGSSVHWYNVQIDNSTTITLNATLIIDGILSTTSTQNVVFAGTHAWSANVLLHNGVGACTLTLQENLQYNIWSALSIAQCRTAAVVHVLSSSAVKAIIYLHPYARCECMARFTDIDAAGGRVINTFYGVVTDCVNINMYTDLKTIATTF